MVENLFPEDEFYVSDGYHITVKGIELLTTVKSEEILGCSCVTFRFLAVPGDLVRSIYQHLSYWKTDGLSG